MEHKNSDKTETHSRRVFIGYSLLSSFLVLITGFAYSVVRYLAPTDKKRGKLQKNEMKIALEDIEVESSQTLRFRGKPIVVVRAGNTEVYALSAVCTHLGCIVKWHGDRKQLICPCHGARFDLSGNVLGGPAPKPLITYSAEVTDNKIVIS